MEHSNPNSNKQTNSLISPRILNNLDPLAFNPSQRTTNNNMQNSISKHFDMEPLNQTTTKKIIRNEIVHRKCKSSQYIQPNENIAPKKLDDVPIMNEQKIEESRIVTLSNQVITSSKCTIAYVLLIILCLFTFVYSLVDIFYPLNIIVIIACEVVICISMIIDIIMRIVLIVYYNII